MPFGRALVSSLFTEGVHPAQLHVPRALSCSGRGVWRPAPVGHQERTFPGSDGTRFGAAAYGDLAQIGRRFLASRPAPRGAAPKRPSAQDQRTSPGGERPEDAGSPRSLDGAGGTGTRGNPPSPVATRARARFGGTTATAATETGETGGTTRSCGDDGPRRDPGSGSPGTDPVDGVGGGDPVISAEASGDVLRLMGLVRVGARGPGARLHSCGRAL